ncbi:HTTM domain-containing protein [Subtercola boreus]|uniref:HTTM domain-containing protein n=1 Tax=Subtercola boreus TaxID=120213 RepID=UPI001168CC94|nr:HTTM domain-containing protein [Subtercola boreus]TQL54766.1 vitamin K-dependent gamma-carboxylase-like protein [Subtercola boreus]
MSTAGLLSRFASWANRGPFTVRDLSRYRIVFGVLVIVSLPDFTWVSGVPAPFYSPPPGPMALLSGPPPLWLMLGVQAAIYVLLVALTAGLYTRFVSIAVSVLMLLGYGLTFSYGKIDHTILMVAVPFVMAFSGWGGRYSLDSIRKPAGVPDNPQWPSRYLAMIIGLAFFTAALPKVASGWLSPSTQSAFGHFASRLVSGRDAPLTELAGALHHQTWLWETVDWLTVILEAGIIVSAVSWASFRIMMAVTTLFHLGVMMSFGILFTSNVIAYGAFVSWGLLSLPQVRWALKKSQVWVGGVVVIVLGVAVFVFERFFPESRDFFLPGIVVIAAVIGAGYLVFVVVRLARRLIERRAAPPTPVVSRERESRRT